jgi:hypothetical protein
MSGPLSLIYAALQGIEYKSPKERMTRLKLANEAVIEILKSKEKAMPKMKEDKQAPGGKGGSAPQKTATGSGSRPGGGKFPIPSSAPSSQKNHRG